MAVMGFAAAFYFWNEMQPPVTSSSSDQFRVVQGDTLSEIASRLEEAGFIRSSAFFSLYSRFKGTTSAMKVGLYQLEPGLNGMEVHDILVSGAQKLYRITIPEGWTVRKIADFLEEQGITNKEEFISVVTEGGLLRAHGFDLSSSEGFLYPDTYLFPREYPAEKVAATFIENFFTILEDIYPDYKQLTSGEIDEVVRLASVVEREYRVPEEAPLIASVFYNRLKQGIKLQSCATVAYIITEIQGKPHPDRLFFSHLEIPSEFNTYLYEGLPPLPISNPGATALEAAFHPAETDYLFFVVKDPDAGTHNFSRSYNEHLNAKDLYLKTR
jgi:UPF0755 protein